MTTSSDKTTGRPIAHSLAIVAAMPLETRPVQRRWGSQLRYLITGEGSENAARSFKAFLSRESVGSVLHIGLAGALSPTLQHCDVVIARRIQSASLLDTPSEIHGQAMQIPWSSHQLYLGTFVDVSAVIWKAADKIILASQLPEGEIGCMDMESATIAGICSEREIPYLGVRCISDLLNEDLPLDFNLCRDVAGSLDQLKILRMALRQPRSLPGLWRLFRRSRTAAAQLACFVEQYLAPQSK
jgi:adenosylhomocysteine nucleosidase